MYQLIKIKGEKKYTNDFLKLPSALYGKKYITQNKNEEQQILKKNHILSKYFKAEAYIVYKDNEICTRCIITEYENDVSLYFGFFESQNDEAAVKMLFNEVQRIAASGGYKNIVGPVNCSFWISYRLKADHYNSEPYISEPYNLSYYHELFEKCGFSVSNKYVSNLYGRITDEKTKYVKRYNLFTSNGYKIESPKKAEFETAIEHIYDMIMELYKDFPIFKSMTKQDFIVYFMKYRLILDYSIVKIAYYENEAVGFFIGMPDYGNLLYNDINIITLLKIYFKKIFCKNYVLMYMGVKAGHEGLGSAILQPILEFLNKKKAKSIGSFIKVGKVSESYVHEEIIDKFVYNLYVKNLL